MPTKARPNPEPKPKKKRGRPTKPRPKPRPRKKTGRPTKFSPEVCKRIVDSLRLGNSRTHACEYAGLASLDTLSRWMEKGEKESNTPYSQFYEDVTRAKEQGIVSNLARITQAGREDWRASAWLLEHCQAERFAKNRIELTGKDGGALRAESTIEAKVEHDNSPTGIVKEFAAPILELIKESQAKHDGKNGSNGNGNGNGK